MKTQILFIAAILTVCVLTAGATPVKYHEVSNTDDLRYFIKNTVRIDFQKVNNYLYDNHIDQINDCVTVRFMIDSNKKIKVITTEADSDESAEYIKLLLNNKKVDVDESFIGKYYNMPIVLKYKAS